MAARIGYDCVGGQAAWVKSNLVLPNVMFWYGTGSPSIQWTAEEKALFPANILCEIDQGGAGSPVMTAVVRDVESGAWGPGEAVKKAGWNVERATLYGSRSTFSACVADGWQGDFWLAWPGWTHEALPSAPGVKIIGVQDVWNANYDHTTFLDADWPRKPASPPPGYELSVTPHRYVNASWDPVPGADHYVITFAPHGGGASVVSRVSQAAPKVFLHNMLILDVPGSLVVDAIVHSKTVPVGTRVLR